MGVSRFHLASGPIEKEFMVPEDDHHKYVKLRLQFYKNFAEPEPSSPAELMAKFLGFVASFVDPNQPETNHEILKYILNEFQETYLIGLDIIELADSFMRGDVNSVANRNVKENLIINYYTAVHRSKSEIIPERTSLKSARTTTTKKVAVCFGQGNINYFAHLKKLYNSDKGFMYADFLVPICNILKSEAVLHAADISIYPQGLDFLKWLDNPSMTPDIDYLMSAPISCPLIALTQLAHYCVICKLLGFTPGEYSKKNLAGATGHGQGIITALAIAESDSWESYFPNAMAAVRGMLSVGYQIGKQDSGAVVKLSGMAYDCVINGEGIPTPLLIINDLSLVQVEGFVTEANKNLLESERIAISLFNGPTNFVVSGSPESLNVLVQILRKNKASKEQDLDSKSGNELSILERFSSISITNKASNNLKQNPIPEGKLKFSCKFLPIYAPFHSHLLNDTYKGIMQEFTLYAEYYTKELKIPVFDPNNGTNLQDYDKTPQEYSLTSRVVKLVTELPVHWEVAARFESAAVFEIGQPDVFGLFK